MGSLVFIVEGRKIIAFGYQGETESATVVYPLLLNYGLSAVGVDSFNCPVEIIGGPWLPSPIAAQLVKVRLFNFKAFVLTERVQYLPELSRFFLCVAFHGQFLIRLFQLEHISTVIASEAKQSRGTTVEIASLRSQ